MFVIIRMWYYELIFIIKFNRHNNYFTNNWKYNCFMYPNNLLNILCNSDKNTELWKLILNEIFFEKSSIIILQTTNLK